MHEHALFLSYYMLQYMMDAVKISLHYDKLFEGFEHIKYQS